MALKELLMIDDLMAPRDAVMVRFSGRNPFETAKMAPNVLKSVMKIPGKDLLETDVRWDVLGGENRDFYGKWMGKRKEDAWSTTKIRIVIQGTQNSKEKTGKVSVEIKGTLTTKYAYANFIQRAFWWFYNRTFYYSQRRKYIDAGKDDIYDIKNVYQEALGIAPR